MKTIFNHKRVWSKTKNLKVKNRGIIATGLCMRCIEPIHYRDHFLISVSSDAIMQYFEEIFNPYLPTWKQNMFWKRCRKTIWIILMIHLGSFCRLHSEGTIQTAWTTTGNYYWSICLFLLRPVRNTYLASLF